MGATHATESVEPIPIGVDRDMMVGSGNATILMRKAAYLALRWMRLCVAWRPMQAPEVRSVLSDLGGAGRSN